MTWSCIAVKKPSVSAKKSSLVSLLLLLLLLLLPMVVGPLAVMIVVEHVTLLYCVRNAVITYSTRMT
jgi:hypothetical protein